MSQPPKRTPLPSRPIGPAPKGRNHPDRKAATSFDKIERRQQQEINRLLSDGPATPSLGDGFGHINVDGTIELDSPGRYEHRTLEGGSQAYRLPIPLPGPRYPPGQGPLVPNNSPASDAEFEKGGEGEEDGYKDDVTKEDKMKNLAFVADGKNVLKRKTETTRISSIDKGKEPLHVLQQSYHQAAGQREPEKLNRKKATEVNWFTTARGKTVKINLPSIQTSKDKGRVKELVQEEKEEENDSTLVNSDEDTDAEGGVTIPVQDQPDFRFIQGQLQS